MRTIMALTAALAVATGAFAQNPAGTWAGRIDMKMPDLSQIKDPAQKKQAEAMLKQVQAMRINLVLNPNKTFKVTTPGMKGPNGQSAPGQSAEGKWAQSGKTITLTTTKENGKAPAAKRPAQTMTMSADGRTLTMIPTQQGGAPQQVKIIFTKS